MAASPARILLWVLPFAVAATLAVLMASSSGQALRYLVWVAAWWGLGWTGAGAVPGLPPKPLSRLALGGVASVLGQLAAWLICVRSGHPAFMPVTPLVAAACLGLASPARRTLNEDFRGAHRRGRMVDTIPTYALAAWSAASTYLLVAFYATTRAQPLPPGTATLYQDLFWHTGISAELQHHVVPHVIEARTGRLNYHWLSDAFMAAISLGSHVPTVVVSARLWILPIILLSTALLIIVAHEITRSWLSAWPAVLIVVFGSSVPLLPWQTIGPSTTFAFLSPSQVFGVPMTLVALLLITRLWRQRTASWDRMLAMLVTFFVCTGSKSSIVPVFLGGTLCSLCWTGLRRLLDRPLLRLQAMTSALLLIALAAALPLFAGGSAGSRIRVLGHLRRLDVVARTTHHPYRLDHGPFWPPGLTPLAVITLLVLVVAAFSSYALAWTPGFVLERRVLRDDPLPALLMGSMASSIIAFLLIDHTGESESYFPMGAMPLLAIAASWSFVSLWEAAGRRRWRDLAAGLVAGSLLTVIWKLAPQSLPREPKGAHGVEEAPNLLVWLVLPALGAGALGLLARWWRRRTGTLLAPLVALGVLGACGPGWLTLTQTVNGVTHPPPRTFAWSVRPGESAGLEWIRQHTPINTLVATNVHCADVVREPHCDASAYWTSALAERRMLVGGWGYTDAAQKRAGKQGYPAIEQAFPNAPVYDLNEAAFYHPTPEVLERLKREGVTYLYADSRVAPVATSLRSEAALVGTWGTASVYRLR